MKVAFFDTKSYDREAFEKYNGRDNIHFKFYETRLGRDTVKLANGYDAVCIFVNDVADKVVIDALCESGCRMIALRCAGYNNVDIDYAKGKIEIRRVPAYSPYAVAEHAMALLLTSVRRTHKAYIRTRDYNFNTEGLTGFDLYNKTVGIIGTGKIGSVFSNICKGFGMKILAYDKYPVPSSDLKYVDLHRLLAESDIISLHCPLNEDSFHMINEKTLALMKKNVIIINTSRGALIDAVALLDSIRSRRIGGACLDVYEEEADIFYNDRSGHILDDEILARLISMPNVIVTSHQAFLTKEALDNIALTTFDNLSKIEGRLCRGI